MINRLFIFFIALFITVLDQLFKFFVSKTLSLGQTVNIWDNLISFTKIHNTGAAFGILGDKTWLLIILSAIIALIIVFYFIKNTAPLPFIEVLCWGLILGGTLGNLIDRIMFGYVIDFINLDFINFPVFNVADLSINIGIITFLIYRLLLISKEKV